MDITNKVGIIPMSAKPLHAGHDGLIKIALAQCESVNVYVSLKDRENVAGERMHQVWNDLIMPHLDPRVGVHFTRAKETPVRAVYEALGFANTHVGALATVYAIYGDPDDLQANFPDTSMVKYLGNLWKTERVIRCPVPRHETMRISGSDMRRYLREGNKDAFRLGLPTWMDTDRVWDILSST